jgi:hypothetical protein
MGSVNLSLMDVNEDEQDAAMETQVLRHQFAAEKAERAGHSVSNGEDRVVRPDPQAAFAAFSSAAVRGHTLALHRVGHLSSRGLGTVRSCASALQVSFHVEIR